MTTQGTEARRGETVGLDAKRDGPFGAADAPQPTDNAETIMTDVQQAVPVAQEDREAAAWLATRISSIAGCVLLGDEIEAAFHQAFARHRLASLPCKSGEGAGEIGDFVMVPRKLTDDMLEAVVKLDFTSTHDPLWPEYWSAMLDAAPTVPDATQTREAEVWQDAWNEFFNEHLTDGNDGYRSTDVISRCRSAFDAAWVGGEKPANDAARAALSARGGA